MIATQFGIVAERNKLLLREFLASGGIKVLWVRRAGWSPRDDRNAHSNRDSDKAAAGGPETRSVQTIPVDATLKDGRYHNLDKVEVYSRYVLDCFASFLPGQVGYSIAIGI
jgi:hypothetical protein